MGFLDSAGLAHLWEKITDALAAKQDKLTGTPGQVVTFGADGNPVPAGGFATTEQVRAAIQTAILDSWEGEY